MTSNIPNQPASSPNPSGQSLPPNQGGMNNGNFGNENTPGNPYQASQENQYHAPMVNNPGNPQGNGYATPQNSPYPQAPGNFQQQPYPQAPGNFQQQPYPGQPVPNMNGGYPTPGALAQPYPDQKSKMAAGLLGIFLGGLGIHNFYLGYTGKAIAQLLISLLSLGFLAIISGIWGLIEGILILTAKPGTPWSLDASGVPLSS